MHPPLGIGPATQACALHWESNWQPFDWQASTQPTEPHQPGTTWPFLLCPCLCSNGRWQFAWEFNSHISRDIKQVPRLCYPFSMSQHIQINILFELGNSLIILHENNIWDNYIYEIIQDYIYELGNSIVINVRIIFDIYVYIHRYIDIDIDRYICTLFCCRFDNLLGSLRRIALPGFGICWRKFMNQILSK